jgi:hypothetical protein
MNADMVFFRYGVSTERGHGCGGYTDTWEQALARCLEAKQLYTDQGHFVRSYAIYDRNDVCVLSRDDIRCVPS